MAAAASSGVAAEQYRALRTRIFNADHRTSNVVLVTSPGRGEGKSVTASNLALAMAQEYQRRACIVDADLRSPQIAKLFGIPEGPGLSDVLLGTATLDEALVTIEEYQITVLPAGRAATHPAELLGTTAMRRTLEALRSQFDRVVIDTPAANPLADVGILTPLVDSVVLVVRAGVTETPADPRRPCRHRCGQAARHRAERSGVATGFEREAERSCRYSIVTYQAAD